MKSARRKKRPSRTRPGAPIAHRIAGYLGRGWGRVQTPPMTRMCDANRTPGKRTRVLVIDSLATLIGHEPGKQSKRWAEIQSCMRIDGARLAGVFLGLVDYCVPRTIRWAATGNKESFFRGVVVRHDDGPMAGRCRCNPGWQMSAGRAT
ncbi:hypothetical protein FA95DRAFT_579401 [Auriscalpium vulgare]|uniref:Uncharacterized protein n=1 Tax=Auriscalpium vulgare TaxID=40419 RepID=A0ACB8S2G5_9AGAM|nr:hypothetical protein FA95DRAFT_579401 [Auriscalpium vulgare]